MNCQDFEKIVLALARNRLLEAATREQGLAHTEVCARCAARLTEEQALMVGVRAVIAELAQEEAPARVEATLLAAFRKQAAAAALPVLLSTPMPGQTRRRAYWKLSAIAAGILLLLGTMAIFWPQSQSPNQALKAKTLAPTPAMSPTPGPQPTAPRLERDREMAQQPSPRRPLRRPRGQASNNDLSRTEIVTEFFSLMEGDDLSTLESGQIVRVELPGSALLTVGLPVDLEITRKPVKADVVLRHDGLARAIRFVYEGGGVAQH